MAYTIAYLVYNVTEATFMGLSFLFIVFLFLAFDFQRSGSDASTECIEPGYGAANGPDLTVEQRKVYGATYASCG
jgi:hypothetical protein